MTVTNEGCTTLFGSAGCAPPQDSLHPGTRRAGSSRTLPLPVPLSDNCSPTTCRWCRALKRFTDRLLVP